MKSMELILEKKTLDSFPHADTYTPVHNGIMEFYL